MNFMELSHKIAELYQLAGLTLDRLDCDITLSKMSDSQVADMSAMIHYFENHGPIWQQEAGYIVCQLQHDLQGLKACFLELPEGEGFSPRSTGYAEHLKKRTA